MLPPPVVAIIHKVFDDSSPLKIVSFKASPNNEFHSCLETKDGGLYSNMGKRYGLPQNMKVLA